MMLSQQAVAAMSSSYIGAHFMPLIIGIFTIIFIAGVLVYLINFFDSRISKLYRKFTLYLVTLNFLFPVIFLYFIMPFQDAPLHAESVMVGMAWGLPFYVPLAFLINITILKIVEAFIFKAHDESIFYLSFITIFMSVFVFTMSTFGNAAIYISIFCTEASRYRCQPPFF